MDNFDENDELWSQEQMNSLLNSGELPVPFDPSTFPSSSNPSTPAPDFSGNFGTPNQYPSQQFIPQPFYPPNDNQSRFYNNNNSNSFQGSGVGTNFSSVSKKIKEEGSSNRMEFESNILPSQPLQTNFTPQNNNFGVLSPEGHLESKFNNTHISQPSFPPSIFDSSARSEVSSIVPPSPQGGVFSPNSDMIQPTPPVNLEINQNRPAYIQLNQIWQSGRQCVAQMEELKKKQKFIMSNQQAFVEVSKAQSDIFQMLHSFSNGLEKLMNIALVPLEIDWLLTLENEFSLVHQQMRVLQKELNFIANNQAQPVLSLAVIAQPFPDSVKQNKTADAPIKVQIYHGSLVDSIGTTKVEAEIVFSTSKGRSKPTVSAEAISQLTNEQGIATFNDIKFPTGTRLKAIKLKFNATVPASFGGNTYNVTADSHESHNIVVKTNENQWYEAEGILLKKALFPGLAPNEEVSFEKFSNNFQRRYIIATKQHLQNPLRPLSSYDFKYIQQLKFNKQPRVNEKDFDSFWTWFGPTLHKIRYQRHMGSLWCKGYICGFLTRNEVEDVLKNEKPGTFIVRFSEKAPGQFSVSYTAIDADNIKHVRHYLVKNDDIHGAKRTFADFLSTFPELETLLQICLDKNNKRLLKRLDKDKILKDFYSKKTEENQSGYIENIQVKEI